MTMCMLLFACTVPVYMQWPACHCTKLASPRLISGVAKDAKAKVHNIAIDISISLAAMPLLAVAVALVLVW